MPRPPYCCHRVTCSRETQRCPDITGTFGGLHDYLYTSTSTGAFEDENYGQRHATGANGDSGQTNFKASRSNGTFGACSTVQPASGRVLLCVKI